MSTGRGAAGSGGVALAVAVDGLRFGALRFLAAGLRFTNFFFLCTPFLPAFFFTLTMRSSVR